MPATTTIRQFNTDVPFSMSLIYDPGTSQYGVIFASQKKECNKSEEHWFPTFGAAWSNYSNNHLYYTGKRPLNMTEEEFHGLPLGTLYPTTHKGTHRRQEVV